MSNSSEPAGTSGSRRHGRPLAAATRRGIAPGRPAVSTDDRFFSHLVSSMRNGVLAFHRDGTLALMNDEAYRIFGLTRRASDIGRPFGDVLRDRPAIIRVLAAAF